LKDTMNNKPPIPGPPADPATSTAGEEDPDASLGDPALRDAMAGEARNAGKDADRALKQEQAAIDNVREGYGGNPHGADKRG
jgi:hypothetical protein